MALPGAAQIVVREQRPCIFLSDMAACMFACVFCVRDVIGSLYFAAVRRMWVQWLSAAPTVLGSTC